jgi:CubicO group peptidase (beta-lactamase class C family)
MRTLAIAVALAIVAAPSLAANPANDWRLSPTAAARLDQSKLTEMERAVAAGTYPKTTSVAIVLNGELAYEHYAGEGAPDKPNDTRSAMKSLTALAVGIAITEKKIPSVDAPAFAYLKHMAPFANDSPLKQQITIADFLTMSSALDCDDNDENSPGNEENMYPKQAWTRFVVDLPTKAGWQRDASGRGPWAYCTVGTFLLGQILQSATGEPVDKFIESRLLDPLGAGPRNWDRSPTGEVMTCGCLDLTTRDLAKLGWMVTDNGRWRGKQIVPRHWIASALTVHRNSSFEPLTYGYQYWHRPYTTACGPLEVWFMSGNGGNNVISIPSRKAAIVITRTAYNTRGMHQQTAELVEKYALAALPCR